MEPPEQLQHQVESEEEEEDMDFIPFLREDIPSDDDDDDNSSALTSDTSPPSPASDPSPNPNPNTGTQQLTAEEEEAICRRTRARVSLEQYSLDELEAFLQGSDDDKCDRQNVDEEEEYRRFLAAVLSDDLPYPADEPGPADEDENDADFDAELEEALESDPDESEQAPSRTQNPSSSSLNPNKRRPETRQKNNSNKTNITISPSKSCLRPILPVETSRTPQQNLILTPNVKLGFSDLQLAELNKIVRDHVQLLVQVFSISVLDPTRQNIASETQGLINELIFKTEESNGNCGYSNGKCSSVLDVEPLKLAKGFLDDANACVIQFRQSQLTLTSSLSSKLPLFPLPSLSHPPPQPNGSETLTSSPSNSFSSKLPLFPHPPPQPNGSETLTSSPSNSFSSKLPLFPHPPPQPNGSEKPQRRSMAALLAEKTKRQSAAMVPAEVAGLVRRFIGFFEEELVPRRPPPPAVANRVLFTDAEDGLLALGFFEYNNDWEAIQKRYLPCKSKHQIFVRAKNQRASKAPENPIKAVRRFKNSPLTSEEKLQIHNGLKVFKNDWHSVWKFIVPYRDPALLPRQYQIALGTQKYYHKKQKTEKEKNRNRIYEANRRHNKRLNEQYNEYDGEALNANKVTQNLNHITNCHSKGLGYNYNNNNNNEEEEEAYVHEAFLSPSISTPQFHNSTIPVPYSKPPFPSLERRNRGQSVVRLAPDLPAVNLPKSVRVISRSTLNLTNPNPRFQTPGFKSPPKPLNLFPNCKNQNSDFQMHPLLFQPVSDGEFVYRSIEKRNGTTSLVPESLSTVDFHPLLQRNEESQNIDLNMNLKLYSSVLGNNVAQLEGSDVNVAQLEKGIVMEQEELSDSEEETENVEFEREEIEDSDSDLASESAHHFLTNNNTDLRNLEAVNQGNQVKSRQLKQKEKGDNYVNKNELKSRKTRAKSTKLDQLDPSSSNKPRKSRK